MLAGSPQPAPNSRAGVGMDVGDQPVPLGAATEPEVDGQGGSVWEWAARHPSGPPPLLVVALSSHRVMATPCLAISLPSLDPSIWCPSQASSQALFYACAQHWPHFWWADPGKQPSTHNPWLKEKVAEKCPIIYPQGSNTEVGTGDTSRKSLNMARHL